MLPGLQMAQDSHMPASVYVQALPVPEGAVVVKSEVHITGLQINLQAEQASGRLLVSSESTRIITCSLPALSQTVTSISLQQVSTCILRGRRVRRLVHHTLT